ncbi:MAG TPA: hypothetical protein ENK60_04205 [Anaerolineae bacterium]|nr:hypothetical protein [Anaerolineae bacterium]
MRKDEIISASEIGHWVYCNRAWYLARTGAENHNVRALSRGQRAHEAHSRTLVRARALHWLAILFLMLAMLLIFVAILLGTSVF